MTSQAADRDRLFPCYVLHRRDYANTSLLVEVFSRAHGRFPLVAKGAKRGRRATAALLQPFRPLLVAFAGRGEVKNLRQVEAVGTAPAIVGEGLYCGFYLNELIVRLVGRNDAHERLFDHYDETLRALAARGDTARTLRRFERQLLAETGYAMVLDREADDGAPLRPDGRYDYDPERGPVPCVGGRGGFSVAGRTLLALADDAPLQGAEAAEAKALMRQVLATYLGPKPLKSREMFQQLLTRKR